MLFRAGNFKRKYRFQATDTNVPDSQQLNIKSNAVIWCSILCFVWKYIQQFVQMSDIILNTYIVPIIIQNHWCYITIRMSISDFIHFIFPPLPCSNIFDKNNLTHTSVGISFINAFCCGQRLVLLLFLTCKFIEVSSWAVFTFH